MGAFNIEILYLLALHGVLYARDSYDREQGGDSYTSPTRNCSQLQKSTWSDFKLVKFSCLPKQSVYFVFVKLKPDLFCYDSNLKSADRVCQLRQSAGLDK